jgi:hypothetical protein|tara:strand:+ start:798 stop:1097 length:300 start_codon:yes stop_codon:yes gene_type:complete
MSSWPTCNKSKRIIKVVEECEITIFGDEMALWTPKSNLSENQLTKRVNRLLDEIGHSHKKELYLFEKVRVIAHHMGIDFWDNDTESDESDESDDENKKS